MNEATATVEIDAKGLLCPLPVLRARKAIKGLSPGAILRVLATDPGSVKDFQHFCQASGNSLLESREEAGVFIYTIRKE
jgi:tRNA 2-thiouridine synthesizing protein A